jgi:hypothetical protein
MIITDKFVGIFTKSTIDILIPTKIKIAANEYFKKWNFSKIPARAKYKDLNPKMAKTFEVNTINGSGVIAKIAGIESTAKIRSVL